MTPLNIYYRDAGIAGLDVRRSGSRTRAKINGTC